MKIVQFLSVVFLKWKEIKLIYNTKAHLFLYEERVDRYLRDVPALTMLLSVPSSDLYSHQRNSAGEQVAVSWLKDQ